MRVWNKLRGWWTGDRVEEALAEEMDVHREMLEEELRAGGMGEREARDEARRRFGPGLPQLEASREEWSWAWLDGLARDVRYGMRMLKNRPGLTLVAALTVGLGVGANTAVMSVLEAVLLNPSGLPEAERVMVATVRIGKLQMKNVQTSAVEFRELAGMKEVFSAVGAAEGRYWTSLVNSEPVRLTGWAVAGDYFGAFRVKPALGRFPERDERNVVVVSYPVWQSQFGGALDVLSKTLELDGVPHRIVGVTEAGFHLAKAQVIWTPLVLSQERLRERGNNMTLRVYARRREGVTEPVAAERVNAYVRSITAKGAEAADLAEYDYGIELTPLGVAMAGDLRRPLLVLWGAALTLLLTGCANMAILLLGRVAGRRREMAIRLSLGASRARILGQLVVESLLLGLLGGVCGLGVAWVGLQAIPQLALPGKDLLAHVQLEPGLLVYGLGLALLSGLVFGLAPALQVMRQEQSSAMVRSSRKSLQGVIVSVQVAAAILLLVTTGLLVGSFRSMMQLDPGVRVEGVASAQVLKPKGDAGFVARLASQLEERAAGQAALVFPLPFTQGGLTSGFTIAGRKPERGQPLWHGEAYMVSPGFFELLGIGVLQGRGFDRRDVAGAPRVCVIDQRLAERFFPGEEAIGNSIEMYGGPARIVGIVRTVRMNELEREMRPVVYYPALQVDLFPSMGILVRNGGLALVRRAVRDTSAVSPIYDEKTLEARLNEAMGVRRVTAILVMLFGGVSLLLAALGLHGVVSQVVGERQAEIGVRMALGASPRQILLEFFRVGFWWSLLGIGVGLLGVFASQSWMAGLLFGVKPLEPWAIGMASAVVLLVAVLATGAPSWRASRLDPQSLLRSQ